MHKLVLAIFILLALGGCYTIEPTSLSGDYKPNPTAVAIAPGLSKDLAWDRAVRLFAERYISIETIDKSSGFIQSNILSFISAYQLGDIKSDSPYPPYIITEQHVEGGSIDPPLYLTGSLRIFVLEDSGQTEIRVNIEDLRIDARAAIYYSSADGGKPHYRALSTSRLESEIAHYISTGKDTANTIRIQNGVVPNPYYSR